MKFSSNLEQLAKDCFLNKIKITRKKKKRLQETFGHIKWKRYVFIETQIIPSFVSPVLIYTKAYRAPLEGYNACLNGEKMDSLVFQDVVYAFNILYFFYSHTHTQLYEAERYNGNKN